MYVISKDGLTTNIINVYCFKLSYTGNDFITVKDLFDDSLEAYYRCCTKGVG